MRVGETIFGSGVVRRERQGFDVPVSFPTGREKSCAGNLETSAGSGGACANVRRPSVRMIRTCAGFPRPSVKIGIPSAGSRKSCAGLGSSNAGKHDSSARNHRTSAGNQRTSAGNLKTEAKFGVPDSGFHIANTLLTQEKRAFLASGTPCRHRWINEPRLVLVAVRHTGVDPKS